MSTPVLGIGGLGDWAASLLPWEEMLSADTPYRFLDTEVTGKTSFTDRVHTLEMAILKSPKPVRIIGQSAGALAALCVASKHPKKITGFIAVSPAMPKGISPLGLPLLKIMWRYQIAMWKSELIKVSREDYTKLALNGVVFHRDFLLDWQQPISGREATELSTPWLQPKLQQIEVPVVYIYGDQDQWVSPRGHVKFASQLKEANPRKTHIIVVEGAGHLPAHSHHRHAIMQEAFSALAEMENTSS